MNDIELPPPTPPADDRPRWNIPHAGTIRCLYAAIERLYAGDTPAEVFEDYGWSVTTTPPADAQITVEVERGRVWIKRGVQQWMLAYDEDEPSAVEWYAQTLRAALGDA
jgi:hypothetical protein